MSTKVLKLMETSFKALSTGHNIMCNISWQNTHKCLNNCCGVLFKNTVNTPQSSLSSGIFKLAEICIELGLIIL